MCQPCISQCPTSWLPTPCISGTGSTNSDISLPACSLYPGGPAIEFNLEGKGVGLLGINPAVGSAGFGTGVRAGTGDAATKGLGEGNPLDINPSSGFERIGAEGLFDVGENIGPVGGTFIPIARRFLCSRRIIHVMTVAAIPRISTPPTAPPTRVLISEFFEVVVLVFAGVL
jgi:hypothetical protein